jgi:hypothetical protein
MAALPAAPVIQQRCEALLVETVMMEMKAVKAVETVVMMIDR